MQRNKRHFLATTLAGTAALAAMASFPGFAADAKKFRIGYSVFVGTNSFVRTTVLGVRAAMDDWKKKGVEVDLLVTNGGDTDVTRQVADMEYLYAERVDGLLIFPGDSVMVAEPVKRLFNADDIPVAIVDVGLSSGESISYISTDNELGGAMAAEHLATILPKGAKVIVFDHGPSIRVVIERNRGFETRAQALGLTVVRPRKFIKVSVEDGRRVMEDTLTEIPDIAGVFLQNHVPAVGAAASLQAANRTDVKVVHFDTDPTAYKMVRDGLIAASVIQKPYDMGYMSMDAMLTHLTGGTLQSETVLLPAELMTSQNADQFADSLQVQK